MDEQAAVKRMMPQSMDAEKSVIGALFMDNDEVAMVDTIITGEDFYNRQYGVIYECMKELVEEGKPVDMLTLSDRLKQKDVAPEVSSLEKLGDIIASVPVTQNARYYAEIVREKSILRRLIRASDETSNSCYAGKDSLEEILAATETRVFNVLNQRRTMDYVPIQNVTRTVLKRIQDAAKSKNPITGIPTGFTDLDNMLAGLQRTDLIIIAARPSVGKTAFALNIAQNAAIKREYTTAIFSLEMSKEQLNMRLLSMESRLDANKLRTGKLDDAEWEPLGDAARAVSHSKIIMDDTPGITINELRTKCRKYKLEFGLDLILIDYLQLMSSSNRRSENRQQEITEISRSLKALAREMECPVIALSQLSRAVESREDHRPMLSDLRESGSIEQDADVVMFLYNADKYLKEGEEPKNIMEIIVAKQRNGPVGSVKLAWQPGYAHFANLDKSKQW